MIRAAPAPRSHPAVRSGLTRHWPHLALLLACTAVVLLVSPVGEFPVDDDWLHARIVQRLITTGRLELSPWLTPWFVLQAFWGGAFAWTFGLSHTALRISTLVLAVGAVVGFYELARQIVGPGRALAGALLLLFNPLFLMYAYSFMTEIPFLALSACSLACGVRALSSNRPGLGWLLASSALAGGALLIRQLGVLLPLALLGGLLLARGPRSTLRPRPLGAIAGPPLVALLIGLLVERGRPPVANQGLSLALAYWSEHGPEVGVIALGRYTSAVLTLGLFLLPITLGWLGRAPRLRRDRRALLVGGTLFAATAAGWLVRSLLFQSTNVFPFLGQALSPRGLAAWNFGTFGDTFPAEIVVPGWALLAFTAAGLLGGVLLTGALASLDRSVWRGPAAMPLLYGALVLGASLPHYVFFDRYLLAIYPAAWLTALIAVRPGRLAWAACSAGLALTAFWGLSWEREYLERRSAVWRAAEAVVALGVSPREIDAGYEWNGWYRGPAAIQAGVERALAEGPGRRLRSFPIVRDIENRNARYVVVYAPPDAPERGSVVPPTRWGHGQQVRVVQRAGP